MKSRFPLLATCICLGLSACATATKESVDEDLKKPVAKGPTLIGRIASAPADKNFVLVQRYGKWDGKIGQILTTRGPENRTANLRTTGEKLGEFAAADIQAGSVEIGDAVYLQHVPNPVASVPSPPESLVPVEEPTAPPTAAAAENLQKNN